MVRKFISLHSNNGDEIITGLRHKRPILGINFNELEIIQTLSVYGFSSPL